MTDQHPFDYSQHYRPHDPDRTQRGPSVRDDWVNDWQRPRQPDYRRVPPPAPPPPPRRKKKRRRAPRLLRTLLQLALAVVLFAVAFVAVFAVIYIVAPPPRTNVLVLGVDARPEEGMVTRTDTIILATVDPAQPYVGMLSIPRDLYVEIPGYGLQRINAAHVFAEADGPGTGPRKVAETVEHNFGVPVHRTLRLNFEGFVAIIDAAGGVTVNVEKPFVDYDYPTPDYGVMTVQFEAGREHMDGERALQYARSRHASTDYDRSARQQQLIAALTKQLVNPLNWWRWPGVMLAYWQNVETDLTLIDAMALAPAVLWVGPDGIEQRVFEPGMMQGRTTEAGASVAEPNWDGLRPVLDEMFRK